MTDPALAVSIPGRGRMYQRPGTDELYPSVTNVIDVMNKPALPSWAAKEVAKAAWASRGALAVLEDEDEAIDLLKGAPWRKRKKAADVGTVVHSVAEALARDQDLPTFGEDEAPFLDGFLGFVKEFKPVFTVAEGTVFSDTHRYAGTFDFLANIGGSYILGDTKTGSGIYREVALQLVALSSAELLWNPETDDLTPMPTIDACIALHLQPNKYAVHLIDADESAFEAFLGLRQAWDWVKDKGGVGPVTTFTRLSAALQPTLEVVK